jgi:hypothetical protein
MSFARTCTGVILAALLACPPGAAEPRAADTPETVVVTYHVKAGEEAAIERVLAEHWQTARRLRLVLPAPHILVAREEHGHHDLIEILTWRDGGIPDDPPEAILQLWARMNALVEPRDGQPGLDFSKVSVLP